MYTFFKKLSTSSIFIEQLPLFALSFGVSELFYKFGSFSLECLAFLATWYLADFLVQTVKSIFNFKYSYSHN